MRHRTTRYAALHRERRHRNRPAGSAQKIPPIRGLPTFPRFLHAVLGREGMEGRMIVVVVTCDNLSQLSNLSYAWDHVEIANGIATSGNSRLCVTPESCGQDRGHALLCDGKLRDIHTTPLYRTNQRAFISGHAWLNLALDCGWECAAAVQQPARPTRCGNRPLETAHSYPVYGIPRRRAVARRLDPADTRAAPGARTLPSRDTPRNRWRHYPLTRGASRHG